MLKAPNWCSKQRRNVLETSAGVGFRSYRRPYVHYPDLGLTGTLGEPKTGLLPVCGHTPRTRKVNRYLDKLGLPTLPRARIPASPIAASFLRAYRCDR